MNFKSPLAKIALLLSSIIAICAQAAPAATSTVDAKPANSIDFAINLFKREALNTNRNVVISPFSAYMALGMTANGASGRTRSQMAHVLGVSGDDFPGFNRNNHTVLQALTKNDDKRFDFANTLATTWHPPSNTNDAQLEIANALYADNACPFKQSFRDICQKDYLAESHNEDFADGTIVRKINSWCDQKTHGKIKKIISQLEPDEKMVLLNSVYFKGLWTNAFKPQDTKQATFKLLNGSLKQVPMMHKTGNCEYFCGNDFEAVALPYLGRRKQVMYIFLPSKQTNFAQFLASFSSKNWRSFTSHFASKEVVLSMPKYKIEFTGQLNKSLIAMGMSDAFSDNANFNALCAQPMKISKVIQKTYVEVDEAGTEAAAVTVVVPTLQCAQAGPPEFTVDRPFVMALADRYTNEILFLGSIVDPTLK